MSNVFDVLAKVDGRRKVKCPRCGNTKLSLYQNGKLKCDECGWFYRLPIHIDSEGEIWTTTWVGTEDE